MKLFEKNPIKFTDEELLELVYSIGLTENDIHFGLSSKVNSSLIEKVKYFNNKKLALLESR